MSRSYNRDRFRPYANGKWWEYTQGTDYTGGVESFRSSAKKWGKANGFRVSTKTVRGKLRIKFAREDSHAP